MKCILPVILDGRNRVKWLWFPTRMIYSTRIPLLFVVIGQIVIHHVKFTESKSSSVSNTLHSNQRETRGIVKGRHHKSTNSSTRPLPISYDHPLVGAEIKHHTLLHVLRGRIGYDSIRLLLGVCQHRIQRHPHGLRRRHGVLHWRSPHSRLFGGPDVRSPPCFLFWCILPRQIGESDRRLAFPCSLITTSKCRKRCRLLIKKLASVLKHSRNSGSEMHSDQPSMSGAIINARIATNKASQRFSDKTQVFTVRAKPQNLRKTGMNIKKNGNKGFQDWALFTSHDPIYNGQANVSTADNQNVLTRHKRRSKKHKQDAFSESLYRDAMKDMMRLEDQQKREMAMERTRAGNRGYFGEDEQYDDLERAGGEDFIRPRPGLNLQHAGRADSVFDAIQHMHHDKRHHDHHLDRHHQRQKERDMFTEYVDGKEVDIQRSIHDEQNRLYAEYLKDIEDYKHRRDGKKVKGKHPESSLLQQLEVDRSMHDGFVVDPLSAEFRNIEDRNNGIDINGWTREEDLNPKLKEKIDHPIKAYLYKHNRKIRPGVTRNENWPPRRLSRSATGSLEGTREDDDIDESLLRDAVEDMMRLETQRQMEGSRRKATARRREDSAQTGYFYDDATNHGTEDFIKSKHRQTSTGNLNQKQNRRTNDMKKDISHGRKNKNRNSIDHLASHDHHSKDHNPKEKEMELATNHVSKETVDLGKAIQNEQKRLYMEYLKEYEELKNQGEKTKEQRLLEPTFGDQSMQRDQLGMTGVLQDADLGRDDYVNESIQSIAKHKKKNSKLRLKAHNRFYNKNGKLPLKPLHKNNRQRLNGQWVKKHGRKGAKHDRRMGAKVNKGKGALKMRGKIANDERKPVLPIHTEEDAKRVQTLQEELSSLVLGSRLLQDHKDLRHNVTRNGQAMPPSNNKGHHVDVDMDDSYKHGDNSTLTAAVDIVDAGNDSISLNATSSPWETLLHGLLEGRREIIIAGCVVMGIGVLVLGGAICSRFMRAIKKDNRNLNSNQSYRSLGTVEEKWSLKDTDYSLFLESSTDDDDDEDYYQR